MIQDQRHIYGGTTPNEVLARWQAIIDETNGARAVRSLPPVWLHHAGELVAARVNHGRWIADCRCGGGMGAWSENPVVACLDCGLVYMVEFPPELERIAAEAVLVMRPDPRTRNWTPARESLEELRAENERGINGVV